MRILVTQLPKNTELFHGCNQRFKFDPEQNPIWVSQSQDVAEYFSTWHGQTRHSKVHILYSQETLRLMRIESRPHLEIILEELGFSIEETLGGEDYQELRKLFNQTKTDGWIIQGNYSQGNDICIAATNKITSRQTAKVRLVRHFRLTSRKRECAGNLRPKAQRSFVDDMRHSKLLG